MAHAALMYLMAHEVGVTGSGVGWHYAGNVPDNGDIIIKLIRRGD